MFGSISTSDLLTYASIIVLALAFIVLVLWVARISSKNAALKQSLMITERELEEVQRELNIRSFRNTDMGAASDMSVDAGAALDTGGFNVPLDVDNIDVLGANDLDETGEVDITGAAANSMEAFTAEAPLPNTPRARRQQEQMQRINRARERQAKLRQKHAEEIAQEQQHKQEIAQLREEQIRAFQKQQDRLRRQMQRERAEQAAEEERQAKLRTRASWSSERDRSNSEYTSRQTRSSQRLEERRQARLRKQAEEIINSQFSDM